MIKQDWNVSEEDRRRILSLHETATKQNYLIFEQKSLTPKNEMPKVATENYAINFQFPTGFHSSRSIDSEGVSITNQVRTAFAGLRDFLKKYDKPKIFNVRISSGESAVRNRDNENEGRPLGPGELGSMRSQTIENLLRTAFQELVDDNVLDSIPEINVETPIIGKSTVKDSPEAKKEQFVRANFIVKGLEKEPVLPTEEIPCDLNVQIKIEYIPTYNSNPKFHCCDNANFTLQLNGVDIKVQGGDSSVFSLNNGKDCGARSQILYVDSETAQSVLSIKQPIDIGFRCESAKCHEAPMLMTVFRDGKQIEEGKYLGTAINRADRMDNGKTKIVGTMDKCGKITFVNDKLITKIGEGNK
jgi:hypothetical protein